MPAPATADEFLGVVEKSRLVTADTLGDYRTTAGEAAEATTVVADRMVRDGVLTRFQAALLLEGKSRPFFVGPYKVLDRIGSGSMGVIYLCEQVAMGRRVAVKVLQARRVRDEVALHRFLREARAAAALNHPNVIQAFDLGREGDTHYLSMEYVEGRSLLAVVRADGALPPRRLVEILRQAATGLAHAHSAGLIHRDIKPSNLMVSSDGVVKLLDLGLARFSESDENVTQGAALGSLGFIPPEQARDSHEVDHRADIFALGATMYFAATGRVPAASRGARDDLRPNAPAGSELAQLLDILERMMATDPADRYQTVAEVVDALAGWDIVLVESGPVADPTAETRTNASVEDAFDTTEAPLRLPAPAPLPPATWTPPVPVGGEPFAFPSAIRPPVPPPRQVQPPPATPNLLARFKWPLALTVAALGGFGVHSLIRGRDASGVREPVRLVPKAVSPNSP